MVLSLPCSTAKVNSVLYIHNRPVVILSPTGRIELIDRITPTSVRSVVSWSFVPSEKFRLASKSSMQNRKHLKIIRHRCGPEQSKQLVAEVSELVGWNCFALGSKRAIDRTVCRAISLIELLEGQKLLSPIGDGSSKTDQSPAPIN
ncbi:hypothetical protein T07_5102 [Trichinella nelsoni]|uniref:Uncharacterized protein n=1 Tax=Trichinella nelsoni TaxID=6336 RepID=A0A0V0RVI0_9BILA|nr:hypothetical protein T07_5102 [Trichinella nelsoni]